MPSQGGFEWRCQWAERVLTWSSARKRGGAPIRGSKIEVLEGFMGQCEFWDLSGVSDEHLLRDLRGFIANGARVDARVVAHLAEIEERRLHLKAACSSLFDYCLRRLGLS